MEPPATPPGAASGPVTPAAEQSSAAGQPAAAGGQVRDDEPLLPEQSREDSDAAWGDYREPSDDRLYQDRPPHWADY